tara:strand:- start:127 stop:555 length:429 start_codon:yes stop_codon:yes gene_type:complete
MSTADTVDHAAKFRELLAWCEVDYLQLSTMLKGISGVRLNAKQIKFQLEVRKDVPVEYWESLRVWFHNEYQEAERGALMTAYRWMKHCEETGQHHGMMYSVHCEPEYPSKLRENLLAFLLPYPMPITTSQPCEGSEWTDEVL